jgi:glycosidase
MANDHDVFASTLLGQAVPTALGSLALPRRKAFHGSPVDWRDQVLYFLLVDRFSDGKEDTRPLIDRGDFVRDRPAGQDGQEWRWDRWAQSGGDRFQGGTIAGVESKLDYLAALGVGAIWLSPVFKQRGHIDSYHGYGLQNFLDVDPRFGTRTELVSLVEAAHAKGIRVILDIIFNHSGHNWNYPGDVESPPFRPFPGFYEFGAFRDRDGAPHPGALADSEAGVWPSELQAEANYTRAGKGSLGGSDIDDPRAEHKRTDFETLRDFALDTPGVLDRLVKCFQYWIALTDCDGFRIDTLKHVSFEEGRNFCGAIKEFAANLGKDNFFLVGEVAGGDFAEDRYLDVLGQNLDAALDIGGMRLTLTGVAKGLEAGVNYFNGFDAGLAEMGSHRNLGSHHVSIVDDHDHVFGEKIRFSSEAASGRQIVAALGLQLFTLGIPCIYYGTEQALAGPEPSQRQFLPGWKGNDRYLRETLFGPRHPRPAGRAGLPAGAEDQALPGFGPFGTAGAHCFDPTFAVYRSIAALNAVRSRFPALRKGRQYPRPVSIFNGAFVLPGAGEIVAWSRILSDDEVLVVVNAHGNSARGGDVLIDASLNSAGSHFTVIENSAATAQGSAAGITQPAGSALPVHRTSGGTAFVEIRNLPPSAVLVLANHA